MARPTFGPAALLADLELRLGLPKPTATVEEREVLWLEHLKREDDGARFYSRSFRASPRSTAVEVLRWRDELVEGGWQGAPLEGSARLRDLTLLDAGAPLPPGRPERLSRVATALETEGGVPYDGVELLEPMELWPGLWLRIFSALAARGTHVTRLEPDFPPAPADSDLGKLQSRIRTGSVAPSPDVRGDGSLLLLTGETAFELAEAVAAYALKYGDGLCIIRAGEEELLDSALRRAGAPSQGTSPVSAQRPLLQLLPLLLSLAFEQREPAELLQLLTLPGGPLQYRAGRELAKALMQQPGIDNAAWRESLDSHAATVAPFLSALTGPGLSRSGAERDTLLQLTQATLDWLQPRLGSTDPQLLAAYAQARAVHDALERDQARTTTFSATRQLLSSVAYPAGGAGYPEQSGAVLRVDSAGLLLQSCARILFWNCVGGSGARRSPWRAAERACLSAAGVELPSAEAMSEYRAARERRAALAAGQQLMLVAPRRAERVPPRTHSLVDELRARLALDDTAVRALTVNVTEVRAGASPLLSLPTRPLAPLPLPTSRLQWTVPPGVLHPREDLSASSLQRLVACPLSYTLHYLARVDYGGAPALPATPLTLGNLGHRLFERLFQLNMFSGPAEPVREAATRLFDELVQERAMALLTQGQSFDRDNLRTLLADSAAHFAQTLKERQLRVLGVEVPIDLTWEGRQLKGSIDVLLEDSAGREVVVDLKWGATSYRELLKSGRALQLAFYAFARSLTTGAVTPPVTAYWSIRSAELLTVDGAATFGIRGVAGPAVFDSWVRAARTLPLVETALRRGTLPVTGLTDSPPLLDTLGVPEAQQGGLLQYPQNETCAYCSFGPICGKAWEGQRP